MCKFRKDYRWREEKDWYWKKKNDEWESWALTKRARAFQIVSKKRCAKINPRDWTKNSFWKLRANRKDDGFEVYLEWTKAKTFTD